MFSRWVTTPLLSRSLKPLVCVCVCSSVYSCHPFLISSASARSLFFLSFIEPIFAWNIPFVSLILLKRSLVFPSLLFPSISLHCLLRLSYLSLLFSGTLPSVGYIFPFLLCLLLLFFSQLFVRSPQTATLPSCISFPWGWFWSPPHVQCCKLHLWFFSHCLPDLIIPWIYLLLLLYNHKGFDLGHTWMAYWFSLLSSI